MKQLLYNCMYLLALRQDSDLLLNPVQLLAKFGSMASPSQFDPPGLGTSPGSVSEPLSTLSGSGGSSLSTDELLGLMAQNPQLAQLASSFRASVASTQTPTLALPISPPQGISPPTAHSLSSPCSSEASTSFLLSGVDPNFPLEGASPRDDTSEFSLPWFSSPSSHGLSSSSSPGSSTPSSSSSSKLLSMIPSGIHDMSFEGEEDAQEEEATMSFVDSANAPFFDPRLLPLVAPPGAMDAYTATVRAQLNFLAQNQVEPTYDMFSNPFLRFPSQPINVAPIAPIAINAPTNSPTKAFAHVPPYTPSSASKMSYGGDRNLRPGAPHFSAPAAMAVARPLPNSPTKKGITPIGHYTHAVPAMSSVNLALAPLRPSAPSAHPPAFGLASFGRQAPKMAYSTAPQGAVIPTTQFEETPSIELQALPLSSADITIGKDYLDQNGRAIDCAHATGLAVMTEIGATLENALLQFYPVLDQVIADLLADLTPDQQFRSDWPAVLGCLPSTKTEAPDSKPRVPRLYGIVSRVERCRIHFFVVIHNPEALPPLKLFERLILHPAVPKLPHIIRIYPVTAAYHPKIDLMQACVTAVMDHCAQRKWPLNSPPGSISIGIGIEAHHASDYSEQLSHKLKEHLPAVKLAEKNPTECLAMLSVCYFNGVFLMAIWEPINPNNLNNYRPLEMEKWASLHPDYIPRTPRRIVHPPDLRPQSLARQITPNQRRRAPVYALGIAQDLSSSLATSGHLYASTAIPTSSSSASILGELRGASPYGAIGSPQIATTSQTAPSSLRSTTSIPRVPSQLTTARTTGALLNMDVNPATANRARSLSGPSAASNAPGAAKTPKNLPGGKRKPNGRH